VQQALDNGGRDNVTVIEAADGFPAECAPAKARLGDTEDTDVG